MKKVCMLIVWALLMIALKRCCPPTDDLRRQAAVWLLPDHGTTQVFRRTAADQ